MSSHYAAVHVSAAGTDRPSTLPRQLCQASEGHPTRRKVVRIRPLRPSSDEVDGASQGTEVP